MADATAPARVSAAKPRACPLYAGQPGSCPRTTASAAGQTAVHGANTRAIGRFLEWRVAGGPEVPGGGGFRGSSPRANTGGLAEGDRRSPSMPTCHGGEHGQL